MPSGTSHGSVRTDSAPPTDVPPARVGDAVHISGVTRVFVVGRLLPGRPRHRVEALRGIDLAVPAGAIQGIIGPNGSGKSTLLRILATLVLPTTGAATVLGVNVAREPRRVRSLLGFSTGEERSLYWRLTGRQNLEFYAALQGMRTGAHRIAELLERLGLADAADRPVSGYSQGMSRRLALARALLHEPRVLILDEPTRSLDPVARDRFHQLLLDLRRERGTTMLLATHDLEEAAALCDQIDVLDRGLITRHTGSGDAKALFDELRCASA